MIRRVTFQEILDQGDLIAEYAAECSLPELGPINPQAHIYEALEQSGIMQCSGVYDGKVMIGFASILSHILPHYGKRVSSTESIFLARASRPAGAGLELINAIEGDAKGSGSAAFLYSAPTGSAFEQLLNRRRDCRRSNSVFVRTL